MLIYTELSLEGFSASRTCEIGLSRMVIEYYWGWKSRIWGMYIVIWERKCCILPKFVPHTYPEKKMQVLWLRYLAETDWQTRDVPVELLENPKIRKAVSILEASAFTPAQLEGCEKFWDMIGVKKSIYDCAEEKGRAEGRIEGRMEGERL